MFRSRAQKRENQAHTERFFSINLVPQVQKIDKPVPENTLLNFVEKRVIFSRIIPHGLRNILTTTNVDAHPHILNEPEWKILLGSQFYFD